LEIFLRLAQLAEEVLLLPLQLLRALFPLIELLAERFQLAALRLDFGVGLRLLARGGGGIGAGGLRGRGGRGESGA